MQSPVRETHSLWEFIEALILDGPLSRGQTRKIANSRNKLTNQVPFLSKIELENLSTNTLAEIGYMTGQVSLDAVCAIEKDRYNLVIRTEEHPIQINQTRHPILGQIVFDPLEIRIYKQSTPHIGRERFTLAHELAHHLLQHGKYLSREFCEEDDFTLQRQGIEDNTEIIRMEFQANYFAASLLMPEANIKADFFSLIQTLEIPDKKGALYVDNQPCNLQNYEFVTRKLMHAYGVSRQAATIRLESLGLINDVRSRSGLRSVKSILAS
jgi:Zn-dependent peptidase ImmA (M78 family)